MQQEGLRVPYSVDRIAWSIAIGSLLAVAAAIALLGYLSFSVYRNLSLSRIHETVTARQYKEVSKELDALFRGPPVLGPLFGRSSAITQSGKDTISGLIQVMGDLSPKTLPVARRRIEALSNNPTLKSDFPPEAAQILKGLEAPISAAAQLEERLEKLIAERAAAVTGGAEARTRFDLLAKDTSDLFSLPPDTVTSRGDSPVFYQSGVLAGLPSLEGLPDGIPNLEDLKAALKRVNGEVRLQGENVQEIFAAKLSTLRTNGADLSAALEAADSAAIETDREIASISADLTGKTERLSEEFDQALRQLLETMSGASR